MTKIFLISPDSVRNSSNISSNVNDKFLETSIMEAQETGFQTIVGTKLYQKLLDLVEKNKIGEQENTIYRQVLSTAKYYLSYTTIVNLCLNSSIKVDNFGLSQANDEHIDPLSVDDILTVRDEYQRKADFYRKRLQEFLWENRNDLPELTENTCNGLKADLFSSAEIGLYLGGERGKGDARITKRKCCRG